MNLNNENKNYERDLLCRTIENYIKIAKNNDNVVDDCISVLAFINVLKKQYPNYSEYFNKYINYFEDNIITTFYKKENNLAKRYFKLYEGNIDKAEEIINSFIPNCSNRFINFMIGIGIIGKPDSKRKRRLLAKAYSWNSYSFAEQSIYYTNLSLRDNKRDTWLLELNADNYLKIKDYTNSLKYLIQSLHINKEDCVYKKIVKVYKQKNDLNGAIIFLKKERRNLFNIKFWKFLNNEIKVLNNEKIGIYKHDFIGYDRIEGFYGKFPNYKDKEKEYSDLKSKYKEVFDEHIKRLDKIANIIVTGLDDNNIDDFVSSAITDIESFYKIENFYKELNSFGLTNDYYYSDNYIRGYLLPKKTIMFLEKNNYIDEAIKLCDISITNNIIWDNTKSGIIGRKERLLKKKNISSN